jgi:hypothetical protein
MTAAAKAIRTTVGLAAAVLVLAACARPGLAGAGNGPGSGNQAGNQNAPSTVAATTPAAPKTSAPPATHTTTAAAPAGGTRCHTNMLRASVVPGDNAAGHVGRVILFTNTSAQVCTMYGYPGVSFHNGAMGSQINDPAQRSTGEGGPVLVTVPPGGTAHADLLLVNTANYPASTCKPVTAAGILIYPPDETQPLYVASAQQVCSVKGTGVAQIYPVHTGA